MPWRGYNFEDAILVSEKMVKEDYYTSVHIEEFELEARDTKLGPEKVTRDIPNVSETTLRNLDEAGVIRIGPAQQATSSSAKLPRKVKPSLRRKKSCSARYFRGKSRRCARLSLYCPPGIEGVVVDVKIFSRKGQEKDERAKAIGETRLPSSKRTFGRNSNSDR